MEETKKHNIHKLSKI